MSNSVLVQNAVPIYETAMQAIQAIKDGDVEPITAYINLSKMEKSIAMIKDDKDVRDIVLRELAKYGKKHTFGDVTLEEAEAGVKYDYSVCEDDKLNEMYELRKKLDAEIKERESFLRTIPESGVADTETGAVIYRAARSSKTIIRTTIKQK